VGDVLGLRGYKTFAAQYPTPHNCCVRFVAAVADGLTQHSLPGGCYPLPGPDFHRLDQISFSWRTPSFSQGSKSICEHRDFGEHFREPLDQRQQPLFWHGWDKIVEHAALTEQRVGASLGII
jgi:hypothetical protein